MNLDMRHVNLAIKESHISVPTVYTLRHELNENESSSSDHSSRFEEFLTDVSVQRFIHIWNSQNLE